MEDGHRRKHRRKHHRKHRRILLIEEIDSIIKYWEHERLRLSHLAAMRTGVHKRFLGQDYIEALDEGWGDGTRLRHLDHVLCCNLQLNAYCALRNDITESNASEAVVLLSLSIPVFRTKELGGVLRMIQYFSSMPSYPDTGPEPSVTQLFDTTPLEHTWIRWILQYYEKVLPGVEF